MPNDKPYASVAEAWEDFKAKCVPKDAHESQKRTMEETFYAGGGLIFKMVTCRPEEESDEDTMAFLDRTHAEFETYIMQKLMAFAKEKPNG